VPTAALTQVCINYLYPVFFCAAMAPDMSQVGHPVVGMASGSAPHDLVAPLAPFLPQWQVGYFVDVGMQVAGWVGGWAAFGAACSGMNNFIPQMSTTSRGLRFTALYRIIPFGWLGRNWDRYNTPLAAILTQGVLIAVLMTFGFDVLVTINVLFYNVGLLLQFAAFLRLRYTQPQLKRPFVVPGGMPMAWGLMVTITIVVAIGFYAAITTAWWAMVTVVAANVAFVGLGFAWRRWAFSDTLVDDVDAREEAAQAARAQRGGTGVMPSVTHRTAPMVGSSWLKFNSDGGSDNGGGDLRRQPPLSLNSPSGAEEDAALVGPPRAYPATMAESEEAPTSPVLGTHAFPMVSLAGALSLPPPRDSTVVSPRRSPSR